MALRYYISTEEASFFNNNRMGYANSIPTEGNYKVGDFIISSTQENGVFGWVCTVAGNPGEWEVIGSGAADENKVVGYVNAVSFSDTRNSIEIGIDEYEKGKDFLEVHYNGLLLAEGVHYNVSTDGKSIVAIDGDWNENTNDTQQMIFRVLRSNVSVIEPTDGSVTIDKLSNDIKEDLAAIDGLITSVNTQNTTISNINDRVGVLEADDIVTIDKLSNDIKEDLAAIDGLVASVDTQNTTISNINDRVSVIESGMSGKQDKTDNSLATTNKTIVGAINELFQSANNGKQLIASAIGEPLSSNDTFSAMSSDINSLLSTFKTNMTNIGVTVNSSDKFKSLIDKINTTYIGGGLDIISATTLPVTGKENQICVITDKPDNKIVVVTSLSDIDHSTDDIYIYLGSADSNSHNTGKTYDCDSGNFTFKLYIVKIYQNNKNLASYIYQNGTWVEYTYDYVYFIENGFLTNPEIFGTLVSGNAMVETSTAVYICSPKDSGGYPYHIGTTNKKIDFSLYNYIEVVGYHLSSSEAITMMCYDSPRNGHFESYVSPVNYAYSDTSFTTTSSVVTYDIRSWTSTGYLGFECTTQEGNHYIYITDVRLR